MVHLLLKITELFPKMGTLGVKGLRVVVVTMTVLYLGWCTELCVCTVEGIIYASNLQVSEGCAIPQLRKGAQSKYL